MCTSDEHIIAASHDGTAKVRATPTGEDLLTLRHIDDEDTLLSWAFSTDPGAKCPHRLWRPHHSYNM